MLIAVFLTCTAFSQDMPRHVFCAGGGNYESVELHVSWTIGQAEPTSTTYQPEMILSAGFQQDDDIMVSLQEIDQESTVQVYPNPCNNYVQLNVRNAQAKILSYELCDYSGRLLVSKVFPQKAIGVNEAIDLSKMAAGLYQLMVTIDNGNTIKYESIKLIRQ